MEFKKFLLVIAFVLTSGCASVVSHPFFSSKFDCGNGWYAVSETLCCLERVCY